MHSSQCAYAESKVSSRAFEERKHGLNTWVICNCVTKAKIEILSPSLTL